MFALTLRTIFSTFCDKYRVSNPLRGYIFHMFSILKHILCFINDYENIEISCNIMSP